MINFDCLTLEVTRRCGMQCAHCMRGDPQDVQMSSDVIQTLCRKTRRIEELNITGGEPSLGSAALKELVYSLKKHDCKIGAFFCSTNAQAYAPEFADTLTELYRYCEHPASCMLTISLDQFHSAPDPLALQEYRKLPFYNPINEKGRILKSAVLDEGRASDNGIGAFSLPVSPCFFDVQLNEGRLKIGDRVYINVFGDVLPNENLSYQTQEAESLGNLLSRPLVEILLASAFKPPDHWHTSGGQERFCIRLTADEGIFTKGNCDDKMFFPTARDASVIYHRLVHNIHIMPVNPDVSAVPDELRLVTESLSENAVRCIGTRICYVLPGETKHKAVEIEMLRYP